jgi:uncharacterized protein YbcI
MGEAEQKTRFLADVSAGLVQLHHRYYGKGPSKAKTYMVNDTLVSILEGGFTIVERTLIDHGDADAVHDTRLSFHRAMEDEFRALVERSTGRKVIAYMSQIHHDPDLVVDLFVLEPSAEPLVGKHVQEFEREKP